MWHLHPLGFRPWSRKTSSVEAQVPAPTLVPPKPTNSHRRHERTGDLGVTTASHNRPWVWTKKHRDADMPARPATNPCNAVVGGLPDSFGDVPIANIALPRGRRLEFESNPGDAFRPPVDPPWTKNHVDPEPSCAKWRLALHFPVHVKPRRKAVGYRIRKLRLVTPRKLVWKTERPHFPPPTAIPPACRFCLARSESITASVASFLSSSASKIVSSIVSTQTRR